MDPIEADRPLRLTWRSVALYAMLIGAGIAGFYLIKHLGRDLVAPALPGGGEAFGKADPKLKFDVLVHVLLALATIIVTARLLGGLFAITRRFGPAQWRIRQGTILVAGLLSLAWAWSLRHSDPSRAYYGTDARAYQLLAGATRSRPKCLMK